jgi:hypothetical protein
METPPSHPNEEPEPLPEDLAADMRAEDDGWALMEETEDGVFGEEPDGQTGYNG